MSEKEVSAAERGKRLLIYGMFTVVLVAVVAVFVSLWLLLAPLNAVSVVITTTLIVAAIGIVASVVLWFVYTKAILKE